MLNFSFRRTAMNILHPILVALKKAVLLTFVLVVMSASAQYYNIPSGYVKKDTARGTSIYYNEREGVAVQVVDLDLARLEHLIIRKSGNEYNLAYPGVYKTSKRAFSVINGAFFADGKETTGAISFPFTPGNDVWISKNEHTKTLCIKDNRAYVFDNGYTNPSYNNRCNFSITLLHPRVNKNKSIAIGRTFIGVINSKRGSEGRFIAFLLRAGSSQSSMEGYARDWNISRNNLIQGDGSFSTQIVSNRFELYGTQCPYGFNIKMAEHCEKRKIPHMIGVYPKWSNFKAISYDMAFLFYSVKFQQKYAKVIQNTILNTTKSKFHINIFKKSVL